MGVQQDDRIELISIKWEMWGQASRCSNQTEMKSNGCYSNWPGGEGKKVVEACLEAAPYPVCDALIKDFAMCLHECVATVLDIDSGLRRHITPRHRQGETGKM
jgi:hypothetical protein